MDGQEGTCRFVTVMRPRGGMTSYRENHEGEVDETDDSGDHEHRDTTTDAQHAATERAGHGDTDVEAAGVEGRCCDTGRGSVVSVA